MIKVLNALCTGEKRHTENIQLDKASEIRDLMEHKPYKYLGTEENGSIQHTTMRKKASSEYLSRLKVCKVQHTNKNKIADINQLGMPVLSYSFAIIDCPQTEIYKLDIKARKILTPQGHYRNQ